MIEGCLYLFGTFFVTAVIIGMIGYYTERENKKR